MMSLDYRYYILHLVRMESRIQTSKTHFLIHLSVNTLQEYMRSGINYMVNSFVNGSDRFIGLSLYLDEITLVIDALIKFVCFKRYNSTYPQYFYGYDRDTPVKPLASALLLSIYPYIRAKLDKKYTQLKLQKQYHQYTILEKVFHHVFPLLHLIVQGIDLVFKFKYLLDDSSQYYNLLFYILKAKLVYKKAGEEAPSAIMELINKPFILILFLAYKILNWWYSSSSKSSSPNNINLPVDPPFPTQNVSKTNKCPLCSKKMTNPAVISSSGHVFCYICISNFVRENKKCPLTSVKTQISNIHIIY